MNKRTVNSALIILAIVIISGIFWGGYILSYQPMPEAIGALTSDDGVTVNRVFVESWLNYYYVFEPTGEQSSRGSFCPWCSRYPREPSSSVH